MNKLWIIGSGASSFYLISQIIKKSPNLIIGIIEKDNSPYGLIRKSVSPKSFEFKKLIPKYNELLKLPSVDLRLNNNFGSRGIEGLKDTENIIVYGTGAGEIRKIGGFPYNTKEVFTSEDITFWYNGIKSLNILPKMNLKILIIGYGNVSLDVAEFFSTPFHEAIHIDFPEHVLEFIKANKRPEITIFGRGDIEGSSFTLTELRNFSSKYKIELENDLSNEKNQKLSIIRSGFLKKESKPIIKFVSNTSDFLINNHKLRFILGKKMKEVDFDIIVTCVGYEVSQVASDYKIGWALTNKGSVSSTLSNSFEMAKRICSMEELNKDTNGIPINNEDKDNWFFHYYSQVALGKLNEKGFEPMDIEESLKYLLNTREIWVSRIRGI